jgi:hypothetical protein
MATCWPGRRHERTAWLAGMGANTTAPVIVRTVTGVRFIKDGAQGLSCTRPLSIFLPDRSRIRR